MAARKKSAKSGRSSASRKRVAKNAGKRAGKKAARKTARPKARPKAKRAGAKRTAARRPAAKRTATRRPAAKRAATRRPASKRAGAAPASRPAANVMEINALNGKPASSGIGLTHHHADYTSHDVEGVRRFYTEVLGFGNALYIPEHGYLTVFLSPRSSLGFMAPMPGMPPESWSPPGEPRIYLFVEDVDRAYQNLTSKGVSFDQAPADMPWGHRLATLRDPEGRLVCLAKTIMK